MGVNNLPVVVTRQCRGRELNSQPSSCKSNTLSACRVPTDLENLEISWNFMLDLEFFGIITLFTLFLTLQRLYSIKVNLCYKQTLTFYSKYSVDSSSPLTLIAFNYVEELDGGPTLFQCFAVHHYDQWDFAFFGQKIARG